MPTLSAATDLPHVSPPQALDTESLAQLAEHCLDAVTNTAGGLAALRLRVTTRFLERDQHLHTLRDQLLVNKRRSIVAICQTTSLCGFAQVFQHCELCDISRADTGVCNDSGSADPHMQAKAVKGLFDRMIFAKVNSAAKTEVTRRTRKAGDRYWKAANNHSGGISSDLLKQALPEVFFKLS
jgi:hypothetical protein